MQRRFRWLLVFLIVSGLAPTAGLVAHASAVSPAETAEVVRSALVQGQLAVGAETTDAAATVRQAHAAYELGLAEQLVVVAPADHGRVLAGFEALNTAVEQGDTAGYAAARAQVWTAVLAGSTTAVDEALRQGEGQAALDWLRLREFRTATRFARPAADATLAVDGFAEGVVSLDDALMAVHADLYDTYQARLTEALRTLPAAQASGFAARQAELAALAEGYFLILGPAYAEQKGDLALVEATAAFAALRTAALTGQELGASLEQANAQLNNFRAAPLSPAEQSRRAGQLLRFLSLVPVEYGRGVTDGRVTRTLEVQEAITFHAGAYAAFADLQDLLAARDGAATLTAQSEFEALGQQLASASAGAAASPAAIREAAATLTERLTALMPEAWLAGSSQGDFDVIATLLEQMEAAVRGGEYDLAEAARLEAYAVMETGPEARLMAFAPQLKTRLEELFWNGQGDPKGLAHLIKTRAPLREIQASQAELRAVLGEAETMLGTRSAPAAVATNAGLIVFREGLEAVLILASLMSSMKRAEEQLYRKPMWLGALAALAATVLTWLLAREVLQAMARYGEKLEAVVSLVAIGILLLITNWFFHKRYWTGWIASFHARKRKLISGEAGLWLGLAVLGFTSVYREGFETVLFLQALVLDAGLGVVMLGTAAALLVVLLVGVVTFRLQVNLPYKRMLVVTGILIGAVLLQMVGNTTHVLQVVGWLPLHVIQWLPLPYWVGTWFGVYATWEGLGLQALAAAFVLGSYFLAEHQKRKNA